MASIEPAALPLRFRDDASTFGPPDPPDVSAFLRGSRSGPTDGPEAPAGGLPWPLARSPEDAHEDAPARARPRNHEALGVIPGRRPVDPDGPLVIFLQHPEFGIPALGYDRSLPDLKSWSVRATTFGWLASVPAARRGPGPRRAAQVLAGCLALTLPARADALAPAPTAAPPVQTPSSASARAPELPTEPESLAEEGPATSTEGATPPEPSPIVAPPSPATSSAYGSAAVTDAAWEGVDGFDVVLELKGGRVLRGRVGAVQLDTFTLIDSESGQVLVIPKSGVSSLRVYVPPPIPTKTGTGLIVGGSLLTAAGVPVFISGVVFLAVCPSCVYLHLPMLVIGGGALGGGIPMISRGVQRRSAFQKALQEHRLAPVVSRTPYGSWNGGLRIRF